MSKTNTNYFMASSYKDLVNFAEACHYAKKDMTYFLEIVNNVLSIYNTTASLKQGNKIFEYTFECEEIKNFLIEILDIDEKHTSRLVFVNDGNHYQFLMNYDIFGLLLTAEYLKSKNIPVTHSFQLKSKSGKIRDITAPAEETKPYLQSLNKVLQKAYDKRNIGFQVAYKTGKSIKDNAAPHVNAKYMFKIDLHNFFPSCKKERVNSYIEFLFKNTVKSEFVKEKFLDIILNDDALYIGNPISGTLANVIISKPVSYMKNICDKFGMNFTVYADDMTFSSDKFINKEFIMSIFNRAFVRYNMEDDFTLSENKCYGVSNSKRSTTGVVINNNDDLTCHRKMYQTIRQTLHQLSYGDESHFHFNKLQGQIAFMAMVDDSGKLKTLLTKYKNVVKKYKLMSEEKLTSLGV